MNRQTDSGIEGVKGTRLEGWLLVKDSPRLTQPSKYLENLDAKTKMRRRGDSIQRSDNVKYFTCR